MTDKDQRAQRARLESISHVIHDIADRCADEGDRMYLGSTNDAHTLARQARYLAAFAAEHPGPVVEGEASLLKASPDEYWQVITTEVKRACDSVTHASLLNHQAAHLLAWANIARNAALTAPSPDGEG